jgi:DNA repair protein RadC
MPSEQDKRLTQRMVEAGRLLDIPVIEHIIITEEGYFSFADEGIL